MRRVLEVVDWVWVGRFVIFCSRGGRVGGVGRRESDNRSRKWKLGVLREMSRAYLWVSTLFVALGVVRLFYGVC